MGTWSIIILCGFVVAVLVYLLFIVPGERAYHQRRLELIQRRLERQRSEREKAAENELPD